MAAHGQMGEFNSQREDWMSYSKRLQEYFTANDIKSAEKKKTILLGVVGAEAYQLIRSLVAPEKPKQKTFEHFIKLVQEPLPLLLWYINSQTKAQEKPSLRLLLSYDALPNIVNLARRWMICY